MTQLSLNAHLARLEHQLDALAQRLVLGEPEAVHAELQTLQQQLLEVVRMLQGRKGRPSPDLAAAGRAQGLARRLAHLNTQLQRRAAYVDRALQVLLPAPDRLTYTSAGMVARYGAGRFGPHALRGPRGY